MDLPTSESSSQMPRKGVSAPAEVVIELCKWCGSKLTRKSSQKRETCSGRCRAAFSRHTKYVERARVAELVPQLLRQFLILAVNDLMFRIDVTDGQDNPSWLADSPRDTTFYLNEDPWWIRFFADDFFNDWGCIIFHALTTRPSFEMPLTLISRLVVTMKQTEDYENDLATNFGLRSSAKVCS